MTNKKQLYVPIPNAALFSMHRWRSERPRSMQSTHYHNHIELYYLYGGERYYFIKDKTYRVKKGNLVFIRPYDIHATVNAENLPFDRFLISFKPEILSGICALFSDVDLFRFLETESHIVEFSPREQLFVEGLFEQMIEDDGATGESLGAVTLTALTQLLFMINKKRDERIEKIEYMSSTQKMISEITGYVNNHFDEEISLEELSKIFFISECYLSRTFRRVCGMCLMDYLNGVRIKEAEKLLAETSLPIGKISESVGYQSTTHFGRVFKKTVGCTPREYRNKKQPTCNPRSGMVY